jgi:MinD superfamily P-loop ATPase
MPEMRFAAGKSVIISVASGKGGTGKTTVATNLAHSLKHSTLVDCDVEEPNAHIFIKPQIKDRSYVYTKTPRICDLLCNLCGECSKFCRYNAIAVLRNKVVVFPELCHHCGGCAIACPQNAIIEEEIVLGRIEFGAANGIRFFHGISEVGLAESTPIIRKEKELALDDGICIIDAPAGTSCLMVEAVRESDFCLLVSEPTPFGLNDLALAARVVKGFDIPFGVVINQSDIGDGKLKQYCENENIPVLMELPFDRSIAECYSSGMLVCDVLPAYKGTFVKLYERVRESV